MLIPVAEPVVASCFHAGALTSNGLTAAADASEHIVIMKVRTKFFITVKGIII